MQQLQKSHSDQRDEHTLIMTATGLASPAELRAQALRAERNRRLNECDWTQLSDAPLTAEQKAAWASYRQALRDVPEAAADLDNVVWPVQP
ncbi:phage tail assembly chaperone [Crenobacter luteus]|uniref:tail fiber assembly protein n=1 Tax=Crenobacter luteus TaxID=1452487 RepID=UPI001051E58C|nr:tail fiber assembly protein [Crenobacter luteus]TCP11189.1 phage tail assembly chaperone [Crenobacter luteus]